MTSNTTIEKMESTPFFRQIDSVISLSFNGESDCKPHIFACYNNEVSSSLYLHNKLIVLNSSQSCNHQLGSSSYVEIENMINELTFDVNNKIGGYLLKDIFYDYVNGVHGGQYSYIRYIADIDILYTEKTLASARGFVMYSTGEQNPGSGGGNNGTQDHSTLFNRDLLDQHPILSITGLSATLDNKASTAHTHNYLSSITKSMVEEVLTGDITTHTHSTYALLNGSSAEDFEVKSLTASDISYFKSGLVMFGTEGGSGAGGGNGTFYHDLLENRNLSSQHTIAAITDLQAMLDSKVYSSDARLSNARIASDVYAWAKAINKPIYTSSETGSLPITGGTIAGYLSQTIHWAQGNSLFGRDDIGMYIDNNNPEATSRLRLWNNGRITHWIAATPAIDYDIITSRNRPITANDTVSLNNANLPNSVWFDYNFAGTGAWGTVLSYGSFNNRYEIQLRGGYTSSRFISFRTKNGDNGTWNSPVDIYNTGSEVIKTAAGNLGSLGLYCNQGSLPGYPNSYYPTISTSFSNLYFSTGGRYTFGVSVTNNLTEFHCGDGIGAFSFTQPIIVKDYVQTNQVYCPNNGEGVLAIGTSIGLVGFPNSKVPTIKTTGPLYFTTDTKYHLAIGYNNGKTEFYNGYSPAFRFTAPIHCTGAIVMYSTT